MHIETINPNIENLVASLRDIGYTFEIAVADIIDNSVSAGAQNINIFTAPVDNKLMLSLYDDGFGMDENELREAMRLATKNPDAERSKNDLGRYGLGLKTASFSQCTKLTVASKKNGKIAVRCWDLNYIADRNSWDLQILEEENILTIPYYDKLKNSASGTLVIWQNIDRYNLEEFATIIQRLSIHLSLVFHRFLEGNSGKKFRISINKNQLSPFNPFNPNHPATNKMSTEHLRIQNTPYSITPFILPHHSKVSRDDWDRYATEDGYIKSQGFYLYREKRLLIHGTWWGLHKAKDAHKLARIQIDISNEQDKYWGIDVKKSTAHPIPMIKEELKRIISNVTKTSFRPFQARGRRMADKNIVRFWEKYVENNKVSFRVNKKHPLLEKLQAELNDDQRNILKLFYEGLEAYLPLATIQAEMQKSPHSVKQNILDDKRLHELIETLRLQGFDDDWIERLKQTELIKKGQP